ncbi:MAG: hypothetical protein QG566_645 [Patescibacteria group bacterium]|nr:hypothetical protein [Patescibacteria group bacterium]
MFTNPRTNILQCGDITGCSVADLGSGSGFYTMEVADRVGARGKVYSIDIQKGLLDRTRQLAKEKNLKNIEYICSDIEKVGGTKLADNIIHLAIVSNILFQLENKDSFVKEISRIIRPGGQVLFIDWLNSYDNMGPHKNHVVPETMARELFTKNGFKLKERIDVGDIHYGIIFTYEK